MEFYDFSPSVYWGVKCDVISHMFSTVFYGELAHICKLLLIICIGKLFVSGAQQPLVQVVCKSDNPQQNYSVPQQPNFAGNIQYKV